MKNVTAKIEIDPVRDTPKRIFDIEFNPDSASDKTAAQQLLSAIAGDLKIDNDLSALKEEPTRTTNLGTHALYQQQFRNLPVTGAWLRIDVDENGNVYQVSNELVPEEKLAIANRIAEANDLKQKNGTSHQYNKDEITERLTLNLLGLPDETPVKYFEKEEVYFQLNGIPVLAWKVLIGLSNPFAEWKLYINTFSGEVLDKDIITKYLDGKGQVFDPNPVVVLNDTSLNEHSLIPDNAYTIVVLPDLDGTGMLTGKYVTTSGTPVEKRVTSPDLLFNFKRRTQGFTEVMAYFHIDRAQRYIQSIGITNVLSSEAITVNVDGPNGGTSHYSPKLKEITYVTGSIDDAEDAEMILHEYGHAIQDFFVPAFGRTDEGKAMGEGFSDYFAASFFSDKKPANMKPTFANWLSVAFSGSEPPSMRVLNSNKVYRDRGGNSYKDGEIWSACLWEIRQGIGRLNADRLIILHHIYINRTAIFSDAAKAIIMADKILNEGRNKILLSGIFIRRGILPNPDRQNMVAGAEPAN